MQFLAKKILLVSTHNMMLDEFHCESQHKIRSKQNPYPNVENKILAILRSFPYVGKCNAIWKYEVAYY